MEIASLNCAFDITVYQGAGDWRERREKQQEFVREQDRETRRCPYIYARKGYGAQKCKGPRMGVFLRTAQDIYTRALHVSLIAIAPANLKGGHFGTIYVPPLNSDPSGKTVSVLSSQCRVASIACHLHCSKISAMKEGSIYSSGSIVELSSENASIIEYASSSGSMRDGQQPTVRR